MRFDIQAFENHLNAYCDSLEKGPVQEALCYSLRGQGKRFRPALMASLCSHESDAYLDCALALEMVHTYSLIHDDLPAMDNDSLRRGKPTCHIQFNEGLALLAGDALLTDSFRLVSHAKCSDAQRVALIQWFSKAAGLQGMIKGQDLDLLNDKHGNLEDSQLTDLYRLKTGALLGYALVASRILDNHLDDLDKTYEIGLHLGFLFQVQDDVLESTVDAMHLGKSNDSDLKNDKQTYVARYGLDQAQLTLKEGFEQLKHDIINLHPMAHDLLDRVEAIEHRKI